MANKNLTLTTEGREYLINNLNKVQANKEKFPEAAQVDFGEYLADLIQSIEDVPVEGGVVSVSKKPARLLQVFLTMANNVLEKNVIPGYAQRMITPASKKKYAPYLDAAKSRRDIIAKMLEELS
jgi:hypothetical protein